MTDKLKTAYIFYGEEKWLMEQRIKEIKELVFQGSEWAMEYNFLTLEAKDITAQSLIDNLNTMPFMAEKRLVLLNGAELFGFGGKNGESQKQNDGLLLDYLKDPNPSCVLIICNNYLPEKNNAAAYKKFAALDAVEVQNFETLKPQAVKMWVKDYLQAYNSSIDRDALEYLTASSSRSLGILANELEKALIYTGKKRLTLENIKQIVTPTAEDSSFLLLNCLVERKSDAAIKAFRNLLYYGSNEYQLLAFLEKQYVRLLTAKELLKDGIAPDEIGRRLKIYSEYALKETLRQSRAYRDSQLESILAMLLDAEMDLKSQSNVTERMERLLVEMCNALEN